MICPPPCRLLDISEKTCECALNKVQIQPACSGWTLRTHIQSTNVEHVYMAIY